jgi:hypothetical protein
MLDNPFLTGAELGAGQDEDDAERNPVPLADDYDPPVGTELRCAKCGRAFERTNRGGRPPKYCPDHRQAGGHSRESRQRAQATRTRAGASRPAPPGLSAADRALKSRLDAIAGDLQEGVGQLAGTIMPVAPVTAGTLLLTGADGIDGLVRIAANYPRMLDGLEMAARAVPFMAVGKFIAGIALAVSVDIGTMAPVGLAAEYLGVAEAAQKVGWQPRKATMDATPPSTADGSDWTVPPPPRFSFAG